MTKPQTRLVDSPSGLSSLTQYCLPGGASRLAALLLPQILPVFSVVAPCHPGAALRNPVLLQRGQATSADLQVGRGCRKCSTMASTNAGTVYSFGMMAVLMPYCSAASAVTGPIDATFVAFSRSAACSAPKIWTKFITVDALVNVTTSMRFSSSMR